MKNGTAYRNHRGHREELYGLKKTFSLKRSTNPKGVLPALDAGNPVFSGHPGLPLL